MPAGSTGPTGSLHRPTEQFPRVSARDRVVPTAPRQPVTDVKPRPRMEAVQLRQFLQAARTRAIFAQPWTTAISTPDAWGVITMAATTA